MKERLKGCILLVWGFFVLLAGLGSLVRSPLGIFSWLILGLGIAVIWEGIKIIRGEAKKEPSPPPPRTTQLSTSTSYRSCPRCGTELRAGAKFCHRCGAPVKRKEEEARTIVEKVPMKMCLSCGEEVETLRKRCPNCGGTTFIEPLNEDLLEIKAKQEESAKHTTRGAQLIKQGKFAEAEKELRKAIELNPMNATAHGNLGGLLFKQNKPEDAIPWLEKALELDPLLEGVDWALAKARAIVNKSSVEEEFVKIERPIWAYNRLKEEEIEEDD